MTLRHNPFRSALAGMQGASPADDRQMEEWRKRAYVEDGVLMIRLSDPALTDKQRKMLYAIAEARYGHGGSN